MRICCVDRFVAHHDIDCEACVVKNVAFQHFYRDVRTCGCERAVEQCGSVDDFAVYGPVFGQ
jgi:hypothetical protein